MTLRAATLSPYEPRIMQVVPMGTLYDVTFHSGAVTRARRISLKWRIRVCNWRVVEFEDLRLDGGAWCGDWGDRVDRGSVIWRGSTASNGGPIVRMRFKPLAWRDVVFWMDLTAIESWQNEEGIR